MSTIGHERNHTPTSPFPKPFRATFPKPASYTSLIHLLNQPPKPASYTSAKQVSETGQRNNREMAPGRGTAGKAGKAGKAAARTACIRDSAGVRGCAGTACASDEKWREKGQQQQEQTHEMAPEPPVGDPARGGGLSPGPAKLPVYECIEYRCVRTADQSNRRSG